jgi:hypothetical protein
MPTSSSSTHRCRHAKSAVAAWCYSGRNPRGGRSTTAERQHRSYSPAASRDRARVTSGAMRGSRVLPATRDRNRLAIGQWFVVACPVPARRAKRLAGSCRSLWSTDGSEPRSPGCRSRRHTAGRIARNMNALGPIVGPRVHPGSVVD